MESHSLIDSVTDDEIKVHAMPSDRVMLKLGDISIYFTPEQASFAARELQIAAAVVRKVK
jgi:hypothetical protein